VRKNSNIAGADFCLDGLVTQMWKQILNYFTGCFNSGFAEGINLQNKVLNRRGFGFRT